MKIMDLYWSRDEGAIRETDLAYGRKLYVLANKVLQNQEDARQCVGDTYWKAWETIPPQQPAFFFAYLAKLCRKFAFERMDRIDAHVAGLGEELGECIPEKRPGLDLDSRELGAILNRFMESLSRENRLIFLRRYWYMDTTAEIAGRCGISQRRVNARLRRTRGKLHGFLEREGVYL